MNWLCWRPGRQYADYDKLLLARSPRWRWDAYLLRYPEGSFIPPHRDVVEGFRHYRFNVLLRQPSWGGLFYTEAPIYITKRIKFFRSDFEHAVSKVGKGGRLMLSIGWRR